MSASNTDKITDTRNAARPNSARVTSGRSAGGATLACDNLSGWPTASKVHFVTYKIDSNSAVVAGTQLDCYGIVSGNNIGSFTVVDGTDTGHAVGDVVEMLPTAAWGQDLADALSVGHTRTGAHASNLPLTTPILTTPTIADHTNATHTHATAAQGGQLSGSAVAAGSQLADILKNPYKFRASMNAATNTGNNAYAIIPFDTEQFDTGGNHSAGVFTAPIAGFYQFNWNAAATLSTGAPETFIAALHVNGTLKSEGALITAPGVASAGLQGSHGSDIVQLSANDTVDVRTFAPLTRALSVGSTSRNYFSGFIVSAT